MAPPSQRSQNVIHRFKNYIPTPDTYPDTRRAAVLLPLFFNDDGELEVILTVRSMNLNSHPGEVALPGGKADEEDKDLVDTAFREAREEIGLPPTSHTYLTTLQPFMSKSLLIVTPIVSLLNPSSVPFQPIPQPTEVHAVFTAPLERFISSRNYIPSDGTIKGSIFRHHCFNPPHHHPPKSEGYSVTGLTAHILVHAVKVGFGFIPPTGSAAADPEPGVVCQVMEHPTGSPFENAPPGSWMDEMVAHLIADNMFAGQEGAKQGGATQPMAVEGMESGTGFSRM
ncbi:NUDIX hydrolase domain-like protein [Jimgerdemannia flammicorona]|uniref:NUDIX hydrolase domain-like protein n=1 Tax=Jimgerdemannia flammicorona TaxID=994334 RepID=A0A433A0N3_9FUNG|nr:NUDIX hydrolase domain-like protein [Jimgerdemannia flammicorona]